MMECLAGAVAAVGGVLLQKHVLAEGSPSVPKQGLRRAFSQVGEKDAFRDRQAGRPRRVILVRHGESEANVDRKITATVPDYDLHLTQTGRQQALDAGARLKQVVGDDSVQFIVSPYVRTRETFMGICAAWGGPEKVSHYEELLTREQDFGNFDREDMKDIHKEKKDFGSFFFRFPEGESPTDVYNRASLFLESLYRRWEHKKEDDLVIISHGGFLMIFLMRLFRFTHDDYYNFELLKNCEFVVLERPEDSPTYEMAYTMTSDGEKTLGKLRPKSAGKAEKTKTPLWNGTMEDAMIASKSVKKQVTKQLID